MSPRADRQAELRARAEALAERERTLPAALCGACGALVRQGEGMVLAANPWAAETNAAADDIDRHRAIKRLPVLVGWRRRHDECSTAAGIVAGILGITTSDLIAGAALAAAAPPLARQSALLAVHRWPGMLSAPQDRRPVAWAHVADEQRARLRKAVEREEQRCTPHKCSDGPCAWCGVARALVWRRGPETWADGSPAPLCGDCASVWHHRGSPLHEGGRRAAALEALSGAATFEGTGSVDGLTMRAYVDVAVADADRAGTGQPWTYAVDALARIREAARLAWPGSLPEELRSDYRSRANDEARRVAAAAEGERRAAEAERLALEGWPVG